MAPFTPPAAGAAQAADLNELAHRAARRLRESDRPGITPLPPDARSVPADHAPLPWPDDALALRAGEVTSPQLVARALERATTWEPSIHALLARWDDTAMAAAEQAQQELDAGRDRGPMHGIPVLIKDLIDVAGEPTTAASRIRDGHVAAADAPVVAALREAGAILLGKANTHEFAFGALTPPTRNAWDTDRMPGGSSGGSAAAVAAGYTAMAVGTDTGGSIREPSALCGTVGLKPTYGRVSCDGVVPLAWTLDHVGPITRTVADAAALFSAMAPQGGPSGIAPGWDGLRVAIATELCDPVQADIRAALDRAVAAGTAAGCSVSEVSIGDADEVLGILFVVLGAEAAAYHGPWFPQRAGEYGEDVQAYLELSQTFSGATYVDALRAREVLRRRVNAILANYDVLLAPAQAVLAPRVDDIDVEFPDGRRGARDLSLIRPLVPINLTGHPAVSVPVHWSAAGLPVSMQLVGPANTDESLLALGAQLQDLVGWQPRDPTPPSG